MTIVIIFTLIIRNTMGGKNNLKKVIQNVAYIFEYFEWEPSPFIIIMKNIG